MLWLPRIRSTANLTHELGAFSDRYMQARKKYSTIVLGLALLYLAHFASKASEGA